MKALLTAMLITALAPAVTTAWSADRLEDRLDRREDRLDRAVTTGPIDRIKDVIDTAENIVDRRVTYRIDGRLHGARIVNGRLIDCLTSAPVSQI